MEISFAVKIQSDTISIVIVHGLQGHPFKTWASTKSPKVTSSDQSSPEVSRNSNRSSSIVRRFVSKAAAQSSAKLAADFPQTEPNHVEPPTENGVNRPATVFWPADLAPRECPKSRILVYGYDTKVSKYMTGPTNKNHVLSHGKDLVFALSREKTPGRPLIFLAHSLGGIVVKEALAASSVSADVDVKNVVESTAAVIFLGTPHRGSPGFASLGQCVRSILNLFRVETTSVILDTLGLKTSDLMRAQEAFSGLWQKYDFRVKTFQEGLGLSGFHLGVLGNKVVPDYSSLLGDHRERAESLQANHMEMCRFTGADDPNYRKVAGELRSVYRSLENLNRLDIHQNGLALRQPQVPEPVSLAGDRHEDAIRNTAQSRLEHLKFSTMTSRYQTVPRPADGTCSWVFELEEYQDWFQSRKLDSHGGFLLLQGKPGAGKSVLMKEIHSRLSLGKTELDYFTASFFFNAQGQELEHSMAGMFRSLLYQVLAKFPSQLDHFNRQWGDVGFSMKVNDLKTLLASMLVKPSSKRIFILIDALDECDSPNMRDAAYFWREITKRASASGAKLNVLISARHFPHISLSNSPVIIVEDNTKNDIKTYIYQKINLVANPEQDLLDLMSEFYVKSNGVFLWTVLALDKMLQDWDEGVGVSALTKRMDSLPSGLETLFSQIMSGIPSEAMQLSLRLFQWASLTVKPLRLHEWRHVLAFIRQPTLGSLHEWRESDYFIESDGQLERQIKSLSRGLLEVRKEPAVQDINLEATSVQAGAGSLDISSGETRVIEFIHQSAREYFLQGRGFSMLKLGIGGINPIGEAHLSIMMTCLDYLGIAELDDLVKARDQMPHVAIRGMEPARKKRAVFTACRRCRRRKIKCSGDSPCENCVELDMSCDWGAPRYSASSPDHDDVLLQSTSSLGDPAKVAEAQNGESSLIDSGRSRPEVPEADHNHGSNSSSPAVQEREAVLDPFDESSTITSGVDVAEWIFTNQLLLREDISSKTARDSVARSSTSAQTQVLQDYPALLSYATHEFFSHAKMAQSENASPERIIRRLEDGKMWDRWLLLSEAAYPERSLQTFAVRKGLLSWRPWLQELMDEDADETAYRRQRSGSGSVASFGSASSHAGSIH